MPFCKAQSVKPPVDEPISTMILLFTVIEKSLSAFSNFKPPRPTYGIGLPFTVKGMSSFTFIPGLSIRDCSVYTSPAMIIRLALPRVSARFRSTNNTSTLFFDILIPNDSYNKILFLFFWKWTAYYFILNQKNNFTCNTYDGVRFVNVKSLPNCFSTDCNGCNKTGQDDIQNDLYIICICSSGYFGNFYHNNSRCCSTDDTGYISDDVIAETGKFIRMTN